MRERIDLWLHEGKDYSTGVEIYRELGTNAFLLSLFEDGETYYNRLKLEEELLAARETFPKASALMRPKKKSMSSDEFMDLPDEVKRILLDAKSHYRKIMETRRGLFSEDAEERRDAAFKILRYLDKNRDAWSKYEYWKKYSAVPLESVEESYDHLSLAEVAKQLSLDINYVYKYTKRLSTLEGEARANQLERIKQRERRIIELNKRLENG